MAITGDHSSNPPTPHLLEYAIGSSRLFYGDRPYTYGAPADRIPPGELLTPNRIIVRAARAVRAPDAGAPAGLDAYAVFAKGAPVLPSVVFEIAGADTIDNLPGNRQIRQTFLVTVRAKFYKDVQALTTALMDALRKDPSGRVREFGTNLDDGYAANFTYRMRSFHVTIQ